jgi:drug/metabolite transporter (DMT)-like permease
LAPFFILVINHLYKKEKLKPLQVIAAIISISGVYLVLWQKEWLVKLHSLCSV